MGSPVSFSGFNSIDFNMVLDAVMAQERLPLTALQTQKKTLETQSSTFATFLGRLSAFESAVSTLSAPEGLQTLSASSSDAGVGVSTGTGRVEGSYDVVVSQLARAQVTASTSALGSPDDVVATGGTLSLLVAGYPPVDIGVTGSMSLEQIAEAINARSEAPVSASVVQAAPGSYKLVLTGRATGVDHAFTFTSSLTGGAGLSFADADGDGVFGEAGDGNAQDARNAQLTVNNLPITSASNVVTDVVPGVTLTLSKEDPARAINVQVTRDTGAVVRGLEKLVSSYNDIVAFLKDQGAAAANGQASIAREPLLRSLRNELRSTLLGEQQGGAYTTLSRIGLEFDRSGNLQLNRTLLDPVLKDGSADLQKLLTGASGGGGVLAALKSVVTGYTSRDGFITAMRDRLGDQATRLGSRLDAMELQLSVRRAALQKEYQAADALMTQLKGQGSSLNSLGSQYRLF